MTQNLQHSNVPLNQDNEISLLDTFVFLKRSYKLISFVGLLGVAASFGYILITPKQYEAGAIIQIAGIDDWFEKPATLIVRLSYPTAYTPEVVKACGLDSAKNAQAIMSESVKLTIPKGINNLVDLKIIGESPEAAMICAQAVFDLIKTTQTQIATPYIEEAKVKISDYEGRLAKTKDLVAKAGKLDLGMGVVYLSTRDEIHFLLDKIADLRNKVDAYDINTTRLVAPIYASGNPIAPKKRNALLVGLLGGLFLGFLIGYGRQLISSLKAQHESSNL